MKRIFPLILFSFLLGGCAAYKELSPKPELSPAERGYIELKDGKDNFTLDKDKKYYIKFPRPEGDQFVLAMKLNAKSALQYFLTDRFDGGDGSFQKIPDELATHDNTSAYLVNRLPPEYFWVIESVPYDVELEMAYRYVPQWRFTFENKYEAYKKILADNTIERDTYNSVDDRFSFSGFAFAEKLRQLNAATKNVRGMKDELVKLENIFPPNIASSRDTAYENFIALRNKTNDELQFQENYTTVLTIFKKEQDSHGSIAAFLESAPEFAEFVSQRDRFPRPMLEKARTTFIRRLNDAPSFYDDQLRAKNDAKKINFTPPAENARKLYEACGVQVPSDFRTLMSFVDRFNVEASGMALVNEKFQQIDRAFAANPPLTTEALFSDFLSKIADARSKLPESRTLSFDKYGRYVCATMLDAEIRNATARVNASETLFGMSQQFVQRLNANSWAPAEAILREVHYNASFAGVPAVNEQKNRIVRSFEGEIFNRVKQVSHQRVDAFVKANEAAIDNVPALYLDSAFIPVHQISFSASGEAEVQRKRAEVQNYIDKLKFNDFPAASITAIYRDFTRNINDRGVDRARAIVEHGKYYKGTDNQIRSMVNECDPNISKWIIRPKEYRKLFVVPVTTNPRGTNEYLFRVTLKIPSEAQFPVFEINVKLPKEVAEKAGTQAWFESIKLNRTEIKNEGRHTITSPTADNNYESQISPVQMDKDGNNVLEVRFKYPGYKVFEVSTMAQVPIIRKN
ncbi:hypothetical protein FBQ87_03420 [Sphingobacteriales bacterium CHB3]|nr:hypothetical protein [Sphingobacteriales bacterium CHB3]